MKLEDDYYCFACGQLNHSGLKLRFQLDKRERRISTEFIPEKMHQGFKDIVHGGIIGLILDECMVNLCWKLGIHAVSAEYTVRLISPAAVGKKLIFFARIKSENERLLIVEGECRSVENTLIARSSSKCIRLSRSNNPNG